MKIYILSTIMLLAISALPAWAQDADRQKIIDFQDNLYKEFTDSIKSPLPKSDIATFTGHEFFPVDLAYRVEAAFTRTPNEKPFKMATTQGVPQDYVKYGEASFTLNGKPCKLSLYQNIQLSKTEAYSDYLFLPFKDLTNLMDTYGGGRYIDMKMPPANASTIVIDFNQAYNPYCAYNTLYSCPVPPKENSLNAEVKAGIKKPADH